MANSGQYLGNAAGATSAITKEYPVANGVTVNDGDFVYLSSGRVTNASIGSAAALLGMVVGQNSARPDIVTETYSATGDSAGTVRVLVIVEPQAKYALVSNQSGGTLSAAQVGLAFNLTGSAGAQLIDASSTTATNQMELIQFGYKGDQTMGVFMINKHKYKVNG